jgi:hypothetical protein
MYIYINKVRLNPSGTPPPEPEPEEDNSEFFPGSMKKITIVTSIEAFYSKYTMEAPFENFYVLIRQ